jgi:hypothetical protein
MGKAYVGAVLAGVAGGVLGAWLLGHFGAVERDGLLKVAAAATGQEVVSARRIQLLDATGRTRAELAMSPDGGPAIFFFDSGGRNRLVLGLYSPAESEYPFVVLNDTHQHAAGIFRLFGGRETPVVVLKNDGRDRSVYGLNPNSTEPFLVNYSSGGKKTAAFGDF